MSSRLKIFQVEGFNKRSKRSNWLSELSEKTGLNLDTESYSSTEDPVKSLRTIGSPY
jgi:hypothetical protein